VRAFCGLRRFLHAAEWFRVYGHLANEAMSVTFCTVLTPAGEREGHASLIRDDWGVHGRSRNRPPCGPTQDLDGAGDLEIPQDLAIQAHKG
jgi:hypothetical protein